MKSFCHTFSHAFGAVLLVLLLMGCDSKSESNSKSAESGSPFAFAFNQAAQADGILSNASVLNTTGTSGTLGKSGTSANETIKYVYSKDPKTGMVQLRSPIPSSWTVNGKDDAIYMTSSRGMKVHKTESEGFTWSHDPQMRQIIHQSGRKLGAPVSLRQIFEQVIRPNAQAQGYEFVGSHQVTSVEGFWQRFFAAMPNTGTQRMVQAEATEWKTKSGNKSMILLVRIEYRSQQSTYWQLMSTEMEAPASHYDEAKSAYLYSVGNTEMNPHWLAASNRNLTGSIRASQQYWDNATKISRAASQQRINAINASGAASRSVGNTYSDILDISHKGYLSRNNMNNAGQSRTVNGINNTTVITNRESGETYNVDGNNKYYWVNHDGLYVGTDNALFDPRINQSTRDDQWMRFHKEQ